MSNLAPHEIGSIELPAPQWDRANPLLQLLQARHSSREFSARVLPLDVLSTLLWAAFGINRAQTGGPTAPSAHNWHEIEVSLRCSQMRPTAMTLPRTPCDWKSCDDR